MAMDRIADPLASRPSTTGETREEPAGSLAAVPTTHADHDDPRGWDQRAIAVDAATSGVHVAQLAVSNLSPREQEEPRILSRHPLADTDAPAWCEQPSGRVRLAHEVAAIVPCQGDVAWPSGSIDVCGAPC